MTTRKLGTLKTLAGIAADRNQSPDLVKLGDTITKDLGGPGLVASYKTDACAMCGKVPAGFTDELSAKEWAISRLCQVCQDDVFKEPDEDELGEEPAF